LIAGADNEPAYIDGNQYSARFGHVTGLAIDPITGFIFVADSAHMRIRCVKPIILAGDAKGDAPSSSASQVTAKAKPPKRPFTNQATSRTRPIPPNPYEPPQPTRRSVAWFGEAKVYRVETIAGSGENVNIDGPALHGAAFQSPHSLFLDATSGSGPVLFVTCKGSIRRLDVSTAMVSTVFVNGEHKFQHVTGLAMSQRWLLVNEDYPTCTVYAIDLSRPNPRDGANCIRLAGSAFNVGKELTDGSGTMAGFKALRGMAVDLSDDAILVCDAEYHALRRLRCAIPT
jgi:hypothetical protein